MKIPTYLVAHDPAAHDPAYTNGCMSDDHYLLLVGRRVLTLAHRAYDRRRMDTHRRIVYLFDRIAKRREEASHG